MEIIEVGDETNDTRRKFFQDIFGDGHGFIGVASLQFKGDRKVMRESFFEYPQKLNGLLEWINKNYHSKSLYFCPQLLSERKRSKETVSSCPVIWSDLDECDPDILDPAPSIVLRTSPGRHQAFWILDEPVGPAEGEDASHRVAYKYEAFGADKSGWDLSQLLRIPITYNTKYTTDEETYPVVTIEDDNGKKYPLEVFDAFEAPEGFVYDERPFPKELLAKRASAILARLKDSLNPKVLELYREVPSDDWSSALWHLEMLLLEHDLPVEDVFVICWSAKCNKYRRDKRPPDAMWKELCKAAARMEASNPAEPEPAVTELLTPEEKKRIRSYETFVDRYVEWATNLGDAATQYHLVGALTILSSLFSGAVKMRTTAGTIIPNIWVMIMADTTLTRKSTAMSLAMNMIRKVDENVILATDGSMEGLMTSIAGRPGKPGVFLRDEFSGLLEQMKRKDYHAGMAETLTKLYDGEYQKRVLRKETIELKNPILIFFCGGIKSRIFELIEYEQVVSGFLPRFIFVEAEADLDKYRPIGPLSETQDNEQDSLVSEVAELYETYHSDMTLHIAGGQEISAPEVWDCEMTSDAWDRYNQFEKEMVMFGNARPTHRDIYTPMMDRLSKSTMKVAMLLACSRQNPQKKKKVVVDVADILKAISYCEAWRDYAVDVLENAGKSTTEKRLDHVYNMIKRSPEGVGRSTVMQNCKLTARETDWILETLDQRGLIKRTRHGRSEKLSAKTRKRRAP